MPVTFNGTNLFDSLYPCSKVEGPTKTYRAQISQMPGVSGARVYDIGDSWRDFTATGRLIGYNKSILASIIANNQNLQNGTVGTFVGDQGVSYPNCLLMEYQPIGPMVPILFAGVQQWTVEIRASVRWLAPK